PTEYNATRSMKWICHPARNFHGFPSAPSGQPRVSSSRQGTFLPGAYAARILSGWRPVDTTGTRLVTHRRDSSHTSCKGGPAYLADRRSTRLPIDRSDSPPLQHETSRVHSSCEPSPSWTFSVLSSRTQHDSRTPSTMRQTSSTRHGPTVH